eukprot:1104924-Heterocapsa_arctica.AAC.1
MVHGHQIPKQRRRSVLLRVRAFDSAGRLRFKLRSAVQTEWVEGEVSHQVTRAQRLTAELVLSGLLPIPSGGLAPGLHHRCGRCWDRLRRRLWVARL